MPRYSSPDLLRPYENLNIKGGQDWLAAATKRYQMANGRPAAPVANGKKAIGLGYDSAPQMVHGVDTLMHVSGADGLGMSLLEPIELNQNQKIVVAAAMAFHGYMRGGKSYEEAALWGAMGLFAPIWASILAVYAGFAKKKADSRFKAF